MNALFEQVNVLLADPLAFARQQAAAGHRVIGLVGADVPAELVLAADALPVILAPHSIDASALANRYLEPRFMPAVRGLAEDWLQGRLDFLHAVIFPRTDDSAQRLYYYLCELQRTGLTAGPRALLFDNAKVPRPSSLAHTHGASLRLARELGSDLGRLGAAIEQRNRWRDLLQRLSQQRSWDDRLRGSQLMRLITAADATTPSALEAPLSDWLSEPVGAAPRAPRVLLAGSAPPDERLHRVVEEAGGSVIAEFGDHALQRHGDPIRADADALSALAAHCHRRAYGARAFYDEAQQIVQQVQSLRIEGVILWLIEEDEALAWQVVTIERALRQLSIPTLVLTRCRWDGADEAPERIGTFIRHLQVRA